MTSLVRPIPPTTIALQWFVRTVYLGGLPVPIARLRTEVSLPTTRLRFPRITEWGWLDTGAPLSMIPFPAQTQSLIWRPLPGVRTTWAGQPCDVGHIDIWLPDLASSALRAPFSLLPKLPHRDPPRAPAATLLGRELQIARHADLALLSHPQPGILLIR